jgi:ribonucleoside-diphosphate reductase alpha subunit
MRKSPKISPQRKIVTFKAAQPSNSRYGPPPSELKSSNDPSVIACGRVRKRNGNYEEISIAKIERRLKLMSRGLHVDPISLARQVLDSVHDGISVRELDVLAAGFAHEKITDHPDYDVLAARLAVSNHHKETMAPFSEVMRALHAANQIRDNFMQVVERNAARIDGAIDYDRDNLFTYFGFRTFEHSYSLTIVEKDSITGKEVNRCYERPQHMYMRTALELHLDDIEAAIETYNWMSCQYFIHASPTLMNAGKKKAQMSSCFLVAMNEEKDDDHPDSIRGIYQTLLNVALISAASGGIGLHCSIVRAEGSPITSAGRPSSGIIPMLQPYESTANYVDQGRKRKGAVAVYLEPWHADVENFLKIKDNNAESKEWKESGKSRMRDLHIALWIPDIFMQRVDEDGMWSLMCPFYSPDLVDLYGQAFTDRYLYYEQQGWPYVRKTIRARQLWTSIVDSQIHTGEPYMVYKDAVNRKTNHQNLGTIKSSNLCSEIVQFSSSEKTATCNLASISLKAFVVIDEDTDERSYDFDTLVYVVKMMTRNLDKVIDRNYYPVPEARNSNFSERPMGIGVQGLADTYIAMRFPYDSPEAAKLNREIFETIYYAALDASCELAEEYDAPYPSYAGSPVSQGRLQFDMWREEGREVLLSGRWDWDALRARIAKYGVRNSLLVALMPTASTSQLLGNNESFEPFTDNMYIRNVLSGSFKVVNRQMISDLIECGLWNDHLKNKIIAAGGSIQDIEDIPPSIRELYKTAYDIKQRVMLDQAADRGPFIDQSHSQNCHMAQPTLASVTSYHMYGWKKGLKTGLYYLRSKPAKEAVKVTVDPTLEREVIKNIEEAAVAPVPEGWVCRKEEGCVTCSS